MKSIFLASGNPNKLREIREIIPDVTVLSVRDLPQTTILKEPAETASTFAENALIKARWGARMSSMPSLADDSGLIVPALGGAPGVHSARYAGEDKDDKANCQKLLKEMHKAESNIAVPSPKQADFSGAYFSKAYFYCVLVLLRHPEDPAPVICGARWHGRIGREPRGANGFGYDPIFHPDEHPEKTAAELPAETKNKLSHRARAIAKLAVFLKSD